MNFKEMKAKTGLQVVGIIDSLNTYYSEKNSKHYYSVNLIIAGIKEKLNIRLPEEYDRSKLVEDELAKFSLTLDRFGNYQAI